MSWMDNLVGINFPVNSPTQDTATYWDVVDTTRSGEDQTDTQDAIWSKWLTIDGKNVKQVKDSSQSKGGTSYYYDGKNWYSKVNGLPNAELKQIPSPPSSLTSRDDWSKVEDSFGTYVPSQEPSNLSDDKPLKTPSNNSDISNDTRVPKEINLESIPEDVGNTGEMKNWLSSVFSQLLKNSVEAQNDTTAMTQQAKQDILSGARDQSNAAVQTQNALASNLLNGQGSMDQSISQGLQTLDNATTGYQSTVNPLLSMFSQYAQNMGSQLGGIASQYDATQQNLNQQLQNKGKSANSLEAAAVEDYTKNMTEDQRRLSGAMSGSLNKTNTANQNYAQAIGNQLGSLTGSQQGAQSVLNSATDDYQSRVNTAMNGLTNAYGNALNSAASGAQQMQGAYGDAVVGYGQGTNDLPLRVYQGAQDAANATLGGAGTYSNLLGTALGLQQNVANQSNLSSYMDAINGGGVDPQTDAMLKSVRDTQMQSIQDQVQSGVNQTLNRVKQTMGNRGMMDSSYMSDAVTGIAGQQADALSQAASELNSDYAQQRLEYPFKQQQAALSGLQALDPQMQMAQTLMSGAGNLANLQSQAGQQQYQGAVDSSNLQNQTVSNLASLQQRYGDSLYNPTYQNAQMGSQAGQSLANYLQSTGQDISNLQTQAGKFNWDSTAQGTDMSNAWNQFLTQQMASAADQQWDQAYQQAGYNRATNMDATTLAQQLASDMYDRQTQQSNFGRNTGLDLATLQAQAAQGNLDALSQLLGYGNTYGQNTANLQSQLGNAIISAGMGAQSSDRSDYQQIMNALQKQLSNNASLYSMAESLPSWTSQNQTTFTNAMSDMFKQMLYAELEGRSLDIQDDADDFSLWDIF